MVLTVNGVDLTPYIAFKGLKWQRNDVDGWEAGRAMDGTMYRQRISSKVRLDISCHPLKTSETSVVLSAIKPEYVTVTYTDPELGANRTATFYSNNNPASFLIRKPNGDEYWSEITFPLVER